MKKEELLPKIKKKLSSFVNEEKGTISKQSVLSIGALVGAITASQILSSKNVEAGSITLTSTDDGTVAKVTGSHSHHSSHSSHSTHSTHSSHSTHSTHSSSDIRLKKNLEPLRNSLDKVRSLHGFSYKWIDSDKCSIGLIAQEVELSFPQVVHTDPKTGYKSINYGLLVAPLLEAIKEQQDQIDSLKDQVDELRKIKLQH